MGDKTVFPDPVTIIVLQNPVIIFLAHKSHYSNHTCIFKSNIDFELCNYSAPCWHVFEKLSGGVIDLFLFTGRDADSNPHADQYHLVTRQVIYRLIYSTVKKRTAEVHISDKAQTAG